MVLRPVEFNSARYPWTGQADERRFDNLLVVNQIVTVGLVLDAVDAPANRRFRNGGSTVLHG